MFGHDILDEILAAMDPMLTDNDRYQQRAGAEMLAGLLRGQPLRHRGNHGVLMFASRC